MKDVGVKPELQKEQDMAAGISAAEIRQVLAKILQSKYFSHAPKRQRFLQCICDYYLQGRAVELNEYLIGCEAFEKGPDYHPSADPVVRVSAHDVRKKLELYYQNEGSIDSIRLTIPVGTYIPVFSRILPPSPEVPVSPVLLQSSAPAVPATRVQSPPQSSHLLVPLIGLLARNGMGGVDWLSRRIERIWKPLLGASLIIILVSIVSVIGLVNQNRELKQRLAANPVPDESWQAMRQGVYAPFLANQSSTLIVLSNPVVYRTMNGADPEILSQKGIILTHEQSHLLTDYSNSRLPLRANQPLRLIPAFNTYTGIGEAIGGYRLHGLLQNIGEPSLLKQSRSVGADDLKEHDIVLLGSVYANQWAKPLSIKENFVYTTRTTIENLQPQDGEAREFISSFDQRTGALLEDFAVITVVPGVTETNVVMSLSGIYSEGTQAAVEYVTNNNRLIELQNRLREISGGETVPRYFQALLKVRVENSFPTQTTLLHVRALKAASPQ